MALTRPTQRIRITNDEDVRGKIEIDGEPLRRVRGVTLRMEVDRVPMLEVEFLAADTIVEVDAETRYTAHAFGEYAQGADPVAVLRELADRLESKAAAS